jgi:acetyl esterase/lipase
MSVLREIVFGAALLGLACGGGEPGTAAGPVVATPGPGGAVETSLTDLVYATVPRPLRLDLHLPAGQPPFPLVVWVHGGGWSSGTKTLAAGHAALRQRSRGYAVASVEYRLSGEAIFPAQIQDVKSAVRWLRANAARHGLDATRVAAWGSSAGGHLVALLGTSASVPALEDLRQGSAGESSRVQAVVDWYGPTDFLLQAPAHHAATSPESLLLGCDIDDCPDRVALANPITYVDATDPPFLIQHGTRDGTVEPLSSAALHAALLAAGAVSTYVPIEGAGHGGPEFSTAANLALVEAFLDRALRRR